MLFFFSSDPSVSSHPGTGEKTGQEAGVVVSVQEEVGLGGGAGAHRGGEGGGASARPPPVQTPKVFPLRKSKTARTSSHSASIHLTSTRNDVV